MTQQNNVPSNHLLAVGSAIKIRFRQVDSLQGAAWSDVQEGIGLIGKSEWYGGRMTTGDYRLRRKHSDPVSCKWHEDRHRP